MKKTILKITVNIMMACMLCLSLSLTSCIPNEQIGNDGFDDPTEDQKPILKDPEGTKTIGLFIESGDNLAGLYFHKDGYLTSSNGWRLSYAGYMNCISYVDFIPRNTWVDLLYVSYGDGFVGYHETEGFVRFYVTGIAFNDYGAVGMYLKYLPQFYGKEEVQTLSKNTVEFGEDGGEESIAITTKTYTMIRSMSKVNWCRVKQTASVFPYIIDGIDIEVDPNEGSEPRETEVLLTTHGGLTTVVTVYQEGRYIEEE